jgi:hypothetical protein
MELKKTGDIHSTRTGFDFRKDKAPTLLQAIRLKCRECTNDSLNEVKLCECFDCPLWALRAGHKVKDLTK